MWDFVRKEELRQAKSVFHGLENVEMLTIHRKNWVLCASEGRRRHSQSAPLDTH